MTLADEMRDYATGGAVVASRADMADLLREGAEEIDRLVRSIDAALLELGVPQPGYPQPVANAVALLRAARKGAK